MSARVEVRSKPQILSCEKGGFQGPYMCNSVPPRIVARAFEIVFELYRGSGSDEVAIRRLRFVRA